MSKFSLGKKGASLKKFNENEESSMKKKKKKNQEQNIEDWNTIMEKSSGDKSNQDGRVLEMLENIKKTSDKNYICDFEVIFNGDKVKNDELEELFQFPEDEVQIIQKEKIARTVETTINPSLFKKEKFNELPYFVQQSLNFFSSDWLILKRRHEKFSDFATKESINTESLPKQNYEFFEEGKKTEDLKSSSQTEDKLRVELLTKHSSSTDEINRKDRSIDRRKLFSLFNGIPTQIFAKTISVPPYSESSPRKILVECTDIKFKLGDLEPFFCTLSLYDLTKKQRISENLYFELNSPNSKKMLETNPLSNLIPHEITQSTRALFS